MDKSISKIDVEIRISNEDIDDIMVCALEGGINYWCGKCEVVGDYLGEYASDQISRGGELILYDIEDEDEHWKLNKGKLLKGIRMYIENGYYNIVNNGKINAYEIDAEVADCIIQYALFGGIIFG